MFTYLLFTNIVKSVSLKISHSVLDWLPVGNMKTQFMFVIGQNFCVRPIREPDLVFFRERSKPSKFWNTKILNSVVSRMNCIELC